MLVILADALWYRFVSRQSMPYLASLSEDSHSSALVPILGYSGAIRATAFTGLPPSVHGCWSKFWMSPDKSPFKRAQALSFMDRMPEDVSRAARFLLSKTILNQLLKAPRNTKLSIENVPMQLLPLLDYTPDNYNALLGLPVPTIFTMMADNGISWEYVDIPFFPTSGDRRKIEKSLRTCDASFVYIGGLDAAAHRLGNSVERLSTYLRYLDRFIQWVFIRAEALRGPGFHWLVFSDHGMESVRHRISAQTFKATMTRSGFEGTIFFDSTMARLWLRNGAGIRSPPSDATGGGHFLSPEERKGYGVDFRDNRFGDAIFLLDPGYVFRPSYVSWLKPVGMHGYRPDHDSQLGVIVTDLACHNSTSHRHMMSDIMTFLTRGLEL